VIHRARRRRSDRWIFYTVSGLRPPAGPGLVLRESRSWSAATSCRSKLRVIRPPDRKPTPPDAGRLLDAEQRGLRRHHESSTLGSQPLLLGTRWVSTPRQRLRARGETHAATRTTCIPDDFAGSVAVTCTTRDAARRTGRRSLRPAILVKIGQTDRAADPRCWRRAARAADQPRGAMVARTERRRF